MEVKNYTDWMDGTPESVGPEGYPIYTNDPYRGIQEIINVYLVEIKQKNKTLFKSYINPEDYSTGQ